MLTRMWYKEHLHTVQLEHPHGGQFGNSYQSKNVYCGAQKFYFSVTTTRGGDHMIYKEHVRVYPLQQH